MARISINDIQISQLSEDIQSAEVMGGAGNGHGKGGNGNYGGGSPGGDGGFYESERGPGNSRSRTFYVPGNGGSGGGGGYH